MQQGEASVGSAPVLPKTSAAPQRGRMPQAPPCKEAATELLCLTGAEGRIKTEPATVCLPASSERFLLCKNNIAYTSHLL